jgi:transcriptional regulator with XRE-family HTH domain
MGFETLQRRLLARVKNRVQNGELTERGLARMTGISQPHIHHILKGVRGLSVENADRILLQLNMSVTDLLEGGDPGRQIPPKKGLARVASGPRSGNTECTRRREDWVTVTKWEAEVLENRTIL